MHVAGSIVYNNWPMRAESYLTLHRGLLAVALYYPSDRRTGRRAAGWTAPAATVTENYQRPGETSLTTVSGSTFRPPAGGIENMVATTATPVCGIRQSLHA